MRRIFRSPLAERDLDDIWDYIAHHDPAAADRLLDRIVMKLNVLARYPRMGRRQLRTDQELRSFTVDRYVLFYIPLTDGVELVRVLHGARDLAAVLDAD